MVQNTIIVFITFHFINKTINTELNNLKQAGAELCQAQGKLRLARFLFHLCLIKMFTLVSLRHGLVSFFGRFVLIGLVGLVLSVWSIGLVGLVW